MARSRIRTVIVFSASFFILAFGFALFAEASVYNVEDSSRMMFKIHVPMTLGEQAQVIFPDGSSLDMGRVLAVPQKSRHPGFTASKYGLGGQIIATASNAHHIQVSVEDGTGRTMSLLPSQTFANATGFGTSFVVEGTGGSGLWGEYAPFVGSPVYIVNRVGIPVLFNNIQLFQFASALEIRVYRPEHDIEYFEIENVPGGRAWYHDAGGDHQFAVVESGAGGTGRFEGTLYQGRGMVRANHPGVICVSTCPKREIGGFQIVPLSHTYSSELQKTRRMSQYIVLRGIGFEDITGESPFFKGWVRPGDVDSDSRTGWVSCRIKGRWQELPNVSGLTEHTLENVEAIRIYL
ncbi:MAG: hypothetical protein LBR87_02355 [Synergistaceae bacterium]|jgi:hypothetical protein|nr:hypothetical protein [Synergistaceae bacterium]